MNRRGFLTDLLAAPAVITTPGLLMPVRAWAELADARLVADAVRALRAHISDEAMKAFHDSVVFGFGMVHVSANGVRHVPVNVSALLDLPFNMR